MRIILKILDVAFLKITKIHFDRASTKTRVLPYLIKMRTAIFIFANNYSILSFKHIHSRQEKPDRSLVLDR